MNKSEFLKSARIWESQAVADALKTDPSLANYIDKTGRTALHHCAATNAAKTGLDVADSIKIAKALAAAGADVNVVRPIIDEGEEFQATALWYAVAWGKNIKLAQFLLENGANAENCMWAAVWDQNLEIAQLLRSFGAQVDPVFHNETPLLMIVKSKRLKLLNWLVDNGADINFQDDNGFSSLHFAVKRNYTLAQVEELLKYGADPGLETKSGETAIDLAEAQRKTKLVSLLKKYNAG
jgi:ankyrin repeat protein